MNNNDNVNNNFNGLDSLNNNINSTLTPINNNLNSSMQSQISNAVPTNNSFNGQSNNQNNASVLSNTNVAATSNIAQPKVDNVPQQPSINQMNNNSTVQDNNTPVTSSTQQQNNFQSGNVNPIQPQTSNGVMPTSHSFNNQFNNQANNNVLYNANTSATSNAVQPKVNNEPQQSSFNQINNDSTVQSNNAPITAMPQNNNVNPISQQPMGNINQAPINNNSVNNEELLRAFIGNNYDKITTKSFNFAGFFFTTLYMFYRKMFLYGILLFLVNLVVLNIINNFIITIIFGLVVGFFVNKLYLYYANKKIDKIKFQNQGKTIDELKGICSAKGGTSIGKAFLGFIVEVVIALIVVIVMFIFGIASAFINLFTGFNSELENDGIQIGETENNTSGGTNNTYNGMMMYDTNINIKNEFSISVPDNFENDSDDYEYDYEYESEQGIFDACSVSLSVPIGYSSADNLINQMATYHVDDNPTAVTSTTINNINWHWFSYNDSFGKTYYYGTTKNNRVYLLEYEVQKDTDSMCESYKEEIINSIQSK